MKSMRTRLTFYIDLELDNEKRIRLFETQNFFDTYREYIIPGISPADALEYEERVENVNAFDQLLIGAQQVMDEMNFSDYCDTTQIAYNYGALSNLRLKEFFENGFDIYWGWF